MMDLERLKTPVTEIEIAQLLSPDQEDGAALAEAGRDIVRRMAFQLNLLQHKESSASPAGYPPGYVPGSMPPGWGLRRHVDGEIVVTHEDGSGVVICEDGERVVETLFYQMMDDILKGAGG
jgi:hypothetical protein